MIITDSGVDFTGDDPEKVRAFLMVSLRSSERRRLWGGTSWLSVKSGLIRESEQLADEVSMADGIPFVQPSHATRLLAGRLTNDAQTHLLIDFDICDRHSTCETARNGGRSSKQRIPTDGPTKRARHFYGLPFLQRHGGGNFETDRLPRPG